MNKAISALRNFLATAEDQLSRQPHFIVDGVGFPIILPRQLTPHQSTIDQPEPTNREH